MSEQKRMDPLVKAKWVAALRSGEYKQARRALRTGDGFCCLGVLCDLYSKDEWGGVRHNGIGNIPSTRVASWADLPRDYPNPNVVIDGDVATVAEHNDYGRSFSEIADAIEAQL